MVLGQTVLGQTNGEKDLGGQVAQDNTPRVFESGDFFETRIRPLLIQRCYECHSSTTELNGGLGLDSLEAMLVGGDSGVAVTPSNPQDSLILEAIEYRNQIGRAHV